MVQQNVPAGSHHDQRHPLVVHPHLSGHSIARTSPTYCTGVYGDEQAQAVADVEKWLGSETIPSPLSASLWPSKPTLTTRRLQTVTFMQPRSETGRGAFMPSALRIRMVETKGLEPSTPGLQRSLGG